MDFTADREPVKRKVGDIHVCLELHSFTVSSATSLSFELLCNQRNQCNEQHVSTCNMCMLIKLIGFYLIKKKHPINRTLAVNELNLNQKEFIRTFGLSRNERKKGPVAISKIIQMRGDPHTMKIGLVVFNLFL